MEKYAIPPHILQPYRRAWDRLMELRSKLRTLELERERLIQEEEDASNKTSSVTAAAMALVETGRMTRVESIDRAPRLKEIAAELVILRAAIPLQEQHLTRINIEVSKAACAHLRPAYLAIVSRMAAAAKELAAAHVEEVALRDVIGQAELSFTAGLRPMMLRGFGPVGKDSPPNRADDFLNEAREYFPDLRL